MDGSRLISASCSWGAPSPSRVHPLCPGAEVGRQGWAPQLWGQLSTDGGGLLVIESCYLLAMHPTPGTARKDADGC